MKKMLAIIICITILILLNKYISLSHADDSCDVNTLSSCNDPNGPCFDQLKTCSDKLQQALTMSENATRPLESQLDSMQQQIAAIKTSVANIEVDLAQKKKEIDDGYKDIAAKTLIFNEKVRDYYIKSTYNSPLLIFLSSNNATQLTQVLAYQKTSADADKAVITNIALSISDLEEKKKNLESEESRLVALKADLDEQSAKLDKIVSGAKAYQASLNNQIAQLSSKQQQLLAEKLGSLGLPTSAYTTSGGCSSDLTNGKDPGFSPRFGMFTYGVPHRVGMSQYGAKGRAEAGQSYSQILSAYFNADLTSGYNQGVGIHVVGTNEYGESFDVTWNIEDYLKHIYEIPTGWPAESLKAQAIAARSYALAFTNNGSSEICPSQSCQVVKQELNSQAWIDVVNATAGQVLTSGGNPIKAWFSSTAGGYYHSSSDVGWSGTSYTKTGLDASGSVGSFADLQNNAYDKSSPWFYCDWGGRSDYANTAWVKPDELADIVNVLMLAKADSSTQNHLSQLDKPNPDGVDTWDADRVKQELRNRNITPFNSVSSGSVDADFGSGTTTSVHISGDAGSQTFNGTDFKNYFNLRAPSNINIVGPLYNIEQR